MVALGGWGVGKRVGVGAGVSGPYLAPLLYLFSSVQFGVRDKGTFLPR